MRSPSAIAPSVSQALTATLEAPSRPMLTVAFHERATIAPGLVRQILVRRVGLCEDEALRTPLNPAMERIRLGIHHHERGASVAESRFLRVVRCGGHL